MKFKHKKLSNGLNIIGEVNPDAKSAAIGFFVKTGARDETDAINGVSHFLEHMLFKGTDKLSALAVNRVFDDLGAQYNAFTSEENTVFYAATLPEQLEEVAKLWTQLMRPALSDDDFNIEKNVILEEIAMYKDLPQFEIIENCRALHFGTHPCGKSVLGSVENIKALKSEQMREYFSRRYAPNNITAAIAGNFDFDKICGLIELACGGWETKPANRVTEFFAGTAQKKSQVQDSLNRQHICLMSPIVSFQSRDSYAATLLAKIVGDDTGSLFFWKLVDTALAETASMHCDAMDGVGTYYSYIRCAPENYEKVMQTVAEIFTSIKNNKINDKQLRAAKNKVLSSITLKNEVPMNRLVELGFNWVYLNQYRSIEEEIQLIKAVEIDDLLRLLDKYPLEKFTQYSLGPK